MYKTLSAILFLCLIGGLLSNPVWAEENFMLIINSVSEFEEGTHSIITGKTITLDEKPVSNVTIHVHFPSAIIKTTTNSTGQFSATSPVPVEIEEYNVTVYAKKNNMYTSSQFTYQGIESKPKIESQIGKTSKTNEKIELDPFSKMIKQLEAEKIENTKRKTTVQEQKQIDEQRRLSKIYLQNDLKESEKINESYNPRNAFYKFIQKIDHSVRGIFWQQFLFTEQITKHALEAKENALDEGKSSFEAMKVFQKEAAVTQKEVINLNKNLNIQYGNATSDIQNQFDEKGKLPRED